MTKSNEKEIFFKDKENCDMKFSHVEDGEIDPKLKDIDELFGAADVLSMKYNAKHDRNLKFLSVFGAVVVFLFLLYDEAELHSLVFGCIALIGVVIIQNHYAQKHEYLRKYTQYRLLAESLRVQYYLSYAGVKKRVIDILPWFTKKGIPWIVEVLSELPQIEIGQRRSIMNCWIRPQRDYHEQKYYELRRKEEKNDKLKYVMYLTVFAYALALIFEIIMYTTPSHELNVDFIGNILYGLQSVGIMEGNSQTAMIRAILKIFLGTLSAITLLAGNYYGKKSLSTIIEDHRRMFMLYEHVEYEIIQNRNVESDELILDLAREFLFENSAWYAHQKQNESDITFE